MNGTPHQQPGFDGGPRILFFSGGTALAPVAAELSRHTVNALHIITTFDSGGSSAELRRVFAMPAVGDVRARIMALADASYTGSSEAVQLFAYRLPLQASTAELIAELDALAEGKHTLVQAVPLPMRSKIVSYLNTFRDLMPATMQLAGASIGNLALTAGYLTHDRQLEPMTAIFSRMVKTRGIICPVSNDVAHLCVELADGRIINGQHRFTGKTAEAITSPIVRLWLSHSLDDPAPIRASIHPRLAEAIRTADLLCYPVGSFFSSVMANLLPDGVAEAIREASCPKVFLPNLGSDPELFGMDVQAQVRFLLRQAHAEDMPTKALTCLLVDEDASRYPGGIPEAWLAEQGIRVHRAAMVTRPPYLDAARVCRELMLLCRAASGIPNYTA